MAETGVGLNAAGELIVMARLLVLQSKRMLLASGERRLEAGDGPGLRERCDRLRAAAEKAQQSYRKAVLDWGSPGTAQFLFAALATMIEGAEELAEKLRASLGELPAPDSMELRDDINRVEGVIRRWRATLMASVGEHVA